MPRQWFSFACLIGLFAITAPGLSSAKEHPSVAHEVAEEHEAHGSEGTLTLDQVLHNTEFWGTLINFGFLIFLLTWAIRKKGNPALKERAEAVKAELEEAQRLRAEAQATHEEAASRLEQLDREMGQIRAEMTKAGEIERDRMVAQAEEKAARMRRDAEFLIEQQVKQLRSDLTQEATRAAIDAAEKILTAKTNDDDQRRLASDYLNRLVEVTSERQS